MLLPRPFLFLFPYMYVIKVEAQKEVSYSLDFFLRVCVINGTVRHFSVE